MLREVKKLYNNLVEVRDYDVQNAITRNENLVIIYNEQTMTLTPQDLKDRVISTSEPFKSKIGASDSKLIGYRWKPENKDQLKLF